MGRTGAVFPVLMREKADPSSLQIMDDLDALRLQVEEFADIIDEFEAWDSGNRRLDLRHLVKAISVRDAATVLRTSRSHDAPAVWKAVGEYCVAKNIAPDVKNFEQPIDFVRHEEEAFYNRSRTKRPWWRRLLRTPNQPDL